MVRLAMVALSSPGFDAVDGVVYLGYLNLAVKAPPTPPLCHSSAKQSSSWR